MTALLRRLINIRPEEVRAALLACAYFFFILAAYYIIRPIRDEAGVAGGIRNLPWLFTGTMVAMLVVNPAFAAMVARLPRERFIKFAYRFFQFCLLLFFALFTYLPDEQRVWIGRTFYIWTSVFNLFVVSVFWGFMADAFNSEQGKRLFGFIGLGGTLGGIVGSAITATLVTSVGSAGLLVVSAVLLEAAVQAVRQLSGLFAERRQARTGVREGEQVIGGGVWDGVTRVFRSPYLLGIGVYMLLYTIGSTFLYFQQAEIVSRARTDPESQTALFAQIDLAVNVLTVVVQALLTGRIMMWLGVARTLAIVPAISVLGFLGLGFAPSIAMLVAFLVLRRAGNFSLARPSREVLYTVVSREDKFKAKTFNDTFVYRFGDQVGAWANPVLAALGLSMAGVALVAAPISALWLGVGYWLGRRQAVMAATRAQSGESVGREAPPLRPVTGRAV
jgi:ATP:ADP antiporter, AAA family